MCHDSWQMRLKQTLAEKRPFRLAIVGIGHELRGDDAAGIEVTERLRPLVGEPWLVITAAHAPENHTGPLCQFQPDLVLLVDAAHLQAPAGSIHWLDWQETTGLSASTHTLPPYVLARYLHMTLACPVALLGIQPSQTTLQTKLSTDVDKAVDKIVSVLCTCFAA